MDNALSDYGLSDEDLTNLSKLFSPGFGGVSSPPEDKEFFQRATLLLMCMIYDHSVEFPTDKSELRDRLQVMSDDAFESFVIILLSANLIWFYRKDDDTPYMNTTNEFESVYNEFLQYFQSHSIHEGVSFKIPKKARDVATQLSSKLSSHSVSVKLESYFRSSDSPLDRTAEEFGFLITLSYTCEGLKPALLKRSLRSNLKRVSYYIDSDLIIDSPTEIFVEVSITTPPKYTDFITALFNFIYSQLITKESDRK